MTDPPLGNRIAIVAENAPSDIGLWGNGCALNAQASAAAVFGQLLPGERPITGGTRAFCSARCTASVAEKSQRFSQRGALRRPDC
jgi:hypothetical protein